MEYFILIYALFALASICVPVYVVVKLFRLATGNSHHRLRWLLIILLGAGIPIGWIAYSNRDGDQIVFVISNGYRGPITLIVNEYTGTEVSRHDGAYVFHIPSSGLLAIKSMAPLERWHQETARYEDGTAIPVYVFDKLPADTVVLYSFGTDVVDQKTSLPYYLGTVPSSPSPLTVIGSKACGSRKRTRAQCHKINHCPRLIKECASQETFCARQGRGCADKISHFPR